MWLIATANNVQQIKRANSVPVCGAVSGSHFEHIAKVHFSKAPVWIWDRAGDTHRSAVQGAWVSLWGSGAAGECILLTQLWLEWHTRLQPSSRTVIKIHILKKKCYTLSQMSSKKKKKSDVSRLTGTSESRRGAATCAGFIQSSSHRDEHDKRASFRPGFKWLNDSPFSWCLKWFRW